MVEQKQFQRMIDNFSSSKLIGAFRLAIAPARFVIITMAIVAVSLIGGILDICSMPGSDDTVVQAEYRFNDHQQVSPEGLPGVYPAQPWKTMAAIEQYKHSPPKGVFSALWNFCAARFNDATVALITADIGAVFTNIWLSAVAVLWVVRYHTLYTIIFLLTAGPVFCLAGGAVCRSAALEFTRGEKPGLIETLVFAKTNIRGLLTAPLLAIGIVLVLSLFVSLLGVIGNLPWLGEIIMGLGLPIALLFGLLTVVVAIGCVAGLGFLFPVIAFEVSDGFDAISRAISYIFIRPGAMILYTLIATIEGTITYLFVRTVAFLVLIVTYLLMEFGLFAGDGKLAAIWPQPQFRDLMGKGNGEALSFSQTISTFCIHLNVLFIIAVVFAFAISFYLCANTIIYALLREKVDGVPIDKICIQFDETNNVTDTDSD
jgi:hypothetical protein